MNISYHLLFKNAFRKKKGRFKLIYLQFSFLDLLLDREVLVD